MTESMTAAEYRTRVHRVIAKPLDGEPVPFGALTLSMVPPSLNNLFVNVKRKGRGKSGGRIKSPNYRLWQVQACLQLRRQPPWHVAGPIEIRLSFNSNETRSDLDNLLKASLDILMAAGRISDDRNVRKIEAAFVEGVTGTRIEIRKAGYVHPAGLPGRKHSAMWGAVAAIGVTVEGA